MLDAELKSAIDKAAETAISPVEVLSVTLVEGQEYDENEVLFVAVRLPRETGPLPASNYMQAMDAVSRTLLRSNDERMPLLRTVRDGEPDSIEDEANRSS